MSKIWQVLSVALLASSLVGGTILSAEARPGRGDGHAFERRTGERLSRGHARRDGRCGKEAVFRVLHNVDLTAEQRSQINTIRDNYRTAVRVIRTESRSIYQDVMDTLLARGELTTNFATEAAQLGDLAQQRITTRLNALSEVTAVLTETQRQATADLIETRRALCSELSDIEGSE